MHLIKVALNMLNYITGYYLIIYGSFHYTFGSLDPTVTNCRMINE
jgi:hypothetical protein